MLSAYAANYLPIAVLTVTQGSKVSCQPPPPPPPFKKKKTAGGLNRNKRLCTLGEIGWNILSLMNK